MSSFAPGASLGRYRIERLLGTGAMGEVYLAEDPQIGRRVALKTLRVLGVRPEELPERRQRLLREARTAGKLIHPHVVTLFDAGEDGGLLYLAFEYVPGSDLGARLGAGPPLTLGEALRLAREACAGLDHAHRGGIVHRDIKPSNLLLDADGRLKISDFGIAKMAGQATELTVSGSVMGSPHYLSPEQIRGEELDGRSDLFSLGVVLYEMLARRRPFGGETLSTLVYQILQAEPPPLAGLRPDLPPRLHAVVARMLAKERDDRHATAAEVAAELTAVAAELPAAALAAPAAGDEAVEGETRLLDSRGAPPAPMPVAAGTFATAPAPEPGAIQPAPGPPAVPPAPPRSAARRLALPIAAGCGVLVVLAVAALLILLARQPLRPGEALQALAERAGRRPAVEEGALPGAAEPGQLEPGQLEAGQLEAGGRPAPVAAGLEGEEGAGREIEPIDWEIEEPDGEEDEQTARWPPAREADGGGAPGTVGGRSTPGSAGGSGGRPPREADVAGAAAAPGSAPAGPPSRSPDTAGPAPDDPAGTDESAAAAVAPADPPAPPGRPGRPSREPDADLAAGLGLVFRVTPEDAFVLVDGTVIGRAREWGPGGRVYELPGAGTYDVTLRKGGMRDRLIRVLAAADGPSVTAVAARLEPLPGDQVALGDLQVHRVREAVAFEVDAPGAQVLVDGRRVGAAERYSGGLGPRRWLELPRGRHRVSLVAPGRRRVDLVVEVSSGAEERRTKIQVVLPPDAGGGGR